ncbi:MAG: hypothetical protein L0211_17395 [Planctomycetaceae bacterium]|nr:hypothetical protein [Planctomycetaceae bacterium]
MAVRCTRCGEELLGAVNRCWKCGQEFRARPTVDGLPPVRDEIVAGAAATALPAGEALEAAVLVESASEQPAVQTMPPPAPTAVLVAPAGPLPPHPLATPAPPQPRVTSRPTNIAAEGGAYAALALGVFGLVLSWSLFYGALVALVGLLAGIWGIYSPRRNWALVGMLLCALAIGLGTFTGVRQLNLYLTRNAPIEAPTTDEPEILP